MPDRLRISFYGTDWRASNLSNLTAGPMTFDGVRVRCVESVVQAMNFSPDDPRHASCLDLSGPVCKSMIYEAQDASAGRTGSVHWAGRSMSIDSAERYDVIERAMRCKFSTIGSAWEALRLSQGLELEYDTSELDEMLSVPRAFFLDVLCEIRDAIGAGSFPRPSQCQDPRDEDFAWR